MGAALREALVGQARGLIDSDPAAAEQLLHRALKIEPEDGEAKGLLSLLEDHRRQAAVDHCVSEVRQLQSQGDLRAAAAAVEQGLRTFPGEARLVQLQASLKKALEEVRRQELEEARRLRQDARDPTWMSPPCRPTPAVWTNSRSCPARYGLATAAEAVRRSLGTIPGSGGGTAESPRPLREVIRTEPAAQLPHPEPPVRTTPAWQQALSSHQGSPEAVGRRCSRRPRGSLAHLRRHSRIQAETVRHPSLLQTGNPRDHHVTVRRGGPGERQTGRNCRWRRCSFRWIPDPSRSKPECLATKPRRPP